MRRPSAERRSPMMTAAEAASQRITTGASWIPASLLPVEANCSSQCGETPDGAPFRQLSTTAWPGQPPGAELLRFARGRRRFLLPGRLRRDGPGRVTVAVHHAVFPPHLEVSELPQIASTSTMP